LPNANLPFDASKERLRRAQRNLADFVAEHDGAATSPELQKSFQRERDLLETELDAATRFFRKCDEDLNEVLKAGQ
jgi:hypothetical protein